MAPSTLLADFVLPISSGKFLELFWIENAWYKSFLVDKLLDLEVGLSDWQNEKGSEGTKHSRTVKSLHPSQVSFPGLPSHAESHKVQTYEVVDGTADNISIVITESDNIKGIPYADYFSVHTEWKVIPKFKNANNISTDNITGLAVSCSCHVLIQLTFKFHKSTWLQGTIESNSRAELLRVYELWLQAAMAHIQKVDVDTAGSALSNTAPPDLSRGRSITRVESRYDMEKPASGAVLRLSSDANINSPDMDDLSSSTRRGNQYADSSGQYFDKFDQYKTSAGSDSEGGDSRRRRARSSNWGTGSIASSDGEEEMFYDCEEGSLLPPSPDISDSDDDDKSTATANTTPLTAHDFAVNIVEGAFVLAEFVFWAIYRFYMYELRDIFCIKPAEVWSRVQLSFIPGRHRVFVRNPDMYGPAMGVFLLPQVLLLSMEFTHHGCSQSALLGNSVVITVCIWAALSAVYRLLAYFVCPWMEVKHCLCILGYSFYPWSAALLLSYPLEFYSHIFRLPSFLPLVLLGIPAAVAQGYIFWEYVPQSSITIRPNSLHRLIQQYSSWIQKLIWFAPKAIAFAFIAGTHYQLLWYIARVFLPGKRQLCELSALVEPSKYADILTQKVSSMHAVLVLIV